MSETEEDRAYYAAGEAAFIRRRGTPFLLSPKDFALLKQWRALGVPIEAVERGIDEAFSRREERQATGRVNSLSYCRDAVLLAWERRAETAVGKGQGRADAPDVPGALARLQDLLRAVAERRADLREPLEAAVRSLERLAGGTGRSPEEIEESLSRLDRKLASALSDALPEAERRALEVEIEGQLGKFRDRMDEETASRTGKALLRRLLRERLELPRLTLL
jgi:DNA-binding transcriptional MerR regulator